MLDRKQADQHWHMMVDKAFFEALRKDVSFNGLGHRASNSVNQRSNRCASKGDFMAETTNDYYRCPACGHTTQLEVDAITRFGVCMNCGTVMKIEFAQKEVASVNVPL